MKFSTLLSLALLSITVSSFAQSNGPGNNSLESTDLEVQLNCDVKLDKDASLGFGDITLNTKKQNSKMFNMRMGYDGYNGFILVLEPTSKIKNSSDKAPYTAENFSLVLTRFENKLNKAQQLSERDEKLRGETTSVIEFTKYFDEGIITSDYLRNEKIVTNSVVLPQKIAVKYSVARGFLRERQDIEIACKILSVK